MNDFIAGPVRVESEPMDRLTALCAVMTKALDEALDEEREAGLEGSDVRGIIFLSDEEKGGIEMFGYENTGAGLAELLLHMKAMFSTMGKGFGVMNDQGEVLMPIGPLGEEQP